MASRNLNPYVLLVAIVVFGTGWQAPASAATSTAALWHMDETTGTVMQDSSGSSNNGTLHSVDLGQPSSNGTAYGFNGTSSYVSVPDNNTLDPGSAPLTITMNVKLNQRPSTGKDYDLIRKGLAGTAGGDYKIEILETGKVFCRFKGSVGPVTLRNGPNLADGAWHTIQCAKSDSSIKLVVDGITYSKVGTVGSIANASAVIVGAKPGDDFFNGLLDEVEVVVG
ncbi:MAG: LamG domain-containing protein [Actinobacteria bacterium]|nr:LamG domain-containing protein [Actinomycetota bacterium]